MPAYTLKINGQSRPVNVAADTPLLWVLRDHLSLLGTKYGCGMGLCGACTVHINGTATRSCITPISSVGSADIKTIEALSENDVGKKVQQAWLDLDVMQCGYCQAGQIMAAVDLLRRSPTPSDAEIAALGNLCRCGTYPRIRRALRRAAELIQAEAGA
jgi:isoquinoline 1-oxidoreductase alpha subunit